ncbi:MAG: hypothetical protein DRP06_01030 [Candidatus Aenigmatarchaeota archaeon]|nr:MAG: hypothetical protein DRP06_01030 [Candidatus Aenigmarchaeota archaeon]
MGYAFNRGVEIIALGGFGLGADFVTGQVPGTGTALAGGLLVYSASINAFDYKSEISDYLNLGLSKFKNYL